MRLVSITLENYRRFARAELEFPDGVLGLVGRNGAGKSTLVEAIGWALFGHDAARTGKEHLRRSDASGDCRVALAFELGGEHYEVVRMLAGRGQQHLATVKVGGRILVAPGANSAKEASQAMERALRMDRDAFFTSMVARQGELSALSELTPARRKEVVMAMLRIDAVDVAIDLARESRRLIEAQLVALGGERVDGAILAAREQELHQSRATEAAAFEGGAKALADLEASAAAVAKARAIAEERRRAHEALAARAAVAHEQTRAIARALERLRRQVAELASVEAEQAKLAPEAAEYVRVRTALEGLDALRERHEHRLRLEAEVSQLEQDLEQAWRRIEAARAEAAQGAEARAASDKARAERLALEQAVADARAQGRGVDDDLLEARRALADAAARRGELERLGSQAACPLCEQSLADALPRLLERLDADLAGQRARFEALQRKRAHLDQRLGRDGAALRHLQGLEESLRKRAEQLGRREAEAQLLQRALAETEERLRGRRASLEAMGPSLFDEAAYREQRASASRLARAHERCLQLRVQLDRRPGLEEEVARLGEEQRLADEASRTLEAEGRAVGHDAAALQALEERAVNLHGRLRAQAVEVERRRNAVDRLDADLASVAQARAAHQAREARMDALRAEAVLLERLAGSRDAGLLADFRSHLMGRLRPVLAHRAGDLFHACTEGRYDGLDLGEDYDLLVVERGQGLPLARFSGGEADLASLCLRIAIGEVLAERSGEQLGFLVLDEVFGSQDAQRRANILRALALLQGRFRQIVLITHIEEVKDALEHVVYVEDAEDGTSRLQAREEPAPLVVPA